MNFKSIYPSAIEANDFKMISNGATKTTHTSRTCIDAFVTQNLRCNLNVLKQRFPTIRL